VLDAADTGADLVAVLRTAVKNKSRELENRELTAARGALPSITSLLARSRCF
jgi:hypothetical protein